MFYKILLLEILLIFGMISLKVYQSLPETKVSVGETTVVIKSVKEVAKLPSNPITSVSSTERSDLRFPVKGHGPENVISVFGDKRGKNRTHEGIDIKAPRGTAIVATTDGFIERIKEGGNGGKQVYLRGMKGRLFYYAHLEDWSVEEFQAVSAGEVLGTVGDSGNAKGTTPHLHFEIMLGKEKKSIDPLKFWISV